MSPCLGLFSPLHSPVADQRVCEFTEVCYVTVPSQLWSTTPLSQGEGLIFPPAPRGAFRRHPPGVTSFVSGLFNQVCPFTEDCSPFASKRLFFLLSSGPLFIFTMPSLHQKEKNDRNNRKVLQSMLSSALSCDLHVVQENRVALSQLCSQICKVSWCLCIRPKNPMSESPLVSWKGAPEPQRYLLCGLCLRSPNPSGGSHLP